MPKKYSLKGEFGGGKGGAASDVGAAPPFMPIADWALRRQRHARLADGEVAALDVGQELVAVADLAVQQLHG